MGSDAKVLVRAEHPEIRAHLVEYGIASEDRGWIDLGDRDEQLAAELSTALGVATVHWSIHTAVDQIWIRCFERGQVVRELQYAAGQRWVRVGTPRAFEATPQLQQWLKKRRIHASPDGYDVLDCFLGRPPPEPVKPIREPEPTATYYLPEAIVGELGELARRHAASVSTVLHAAWELGKAQVYARRVELDGPVTLAAPIAGAVEAALVHAEIAVPALVIGRETIRCELAFPAHATSELAQMQRAFGEPMAELLRDAYLAARARLL